ncbi:serine/threonine-protein kinase [Rhodohalobacter sp.]|uniref:serine/threonine protein kinase n=1 Tax=Rhodohalobacter sp. TaxID=1974210 RepID=UPI002ACE17B4|nr:serine/threonine-protein kinase [Rhodohalobacter sp.]MDZ7755988.1 serine/threonine-protein kinase [Rhodohalobacter sp.]
MDQSSWELIKSVVDKALTLNAGERKKYIDSACRQYPSISTDVWELLQYVEESDRDHFMKEIWSDQKNLLLDISGEIREMNLEEEFINREIGPYRITDLLGHGGMGAVFKAVRTDGEFHLEAAIKLIRSGSDSADAMLRFGIEKEILAGLKHPNIAHLLDGGITDDGISYLIMEYVDGMPVDQYCDEHRLSLKQRLRLFKEICAAVQYAHNNLIVHRDLKPQNIYVTEEGTVKVLDFGIAKMLQTHLHRPSNVMTLTGHSLKILVFL